MNASFRIFHVGLILLVLTGCVQASKPELVPIAMPVHPEIVSVPEMQSFSDFSIAPAVTAEEIAAFERAWKNIRDGVASQVSVESLKSISRWAVTETQSAKLPGQWIDQLPMRPIAMNKDETRVLFGQTAKEGIILPSQYPIVFRRLVVGAEYDRAKPIISQVYISIRGWREE